MKLITYLIIFTVSFSGLYSQQDSTNIISNDSMVVVPAIEYEAGSLHRFFFGDTWRNVWTTPIKVPVLNLDTYAGGLKPLKKGGGFQTRSLRFEGADGNQYKFRSIQKITDKLLIPELQNTFVDDILFDSYSASNPMSGIIVTPIINAAGVLQAQPFLVLLPDNEKLGEYREEFKNLLGTLELHPDDADDTEESFANADKVFGTYKLFHKLDDNCDYRVDAPEFLKARLLDIYLGDWDRHYDQWRWAVYKKDGKKICKPIPRDRDQALCHYDGLLNYFVTVYVMQIENFDVAYPPVKYLTWSGRYLDRKFLSPLEKSTWDSVATYLVNHITDSVINDAVNKLPAELIPTEGENLRKALISRRNNLKKKSDEYYNLLSTWVDIRCTENPELVEINKLNDLETEVTIYSMDKKDSLSDIKDNLFFHRIFDNNITEEIRLYLLKGDDKVIINGETETGPDIHIIGSKGTDTLIDNSKTGGYLFSSIPFINSSDTKNYLWDSEEKSFIVEGPSTAIKDKKLEEPENDTLKYEPPVRDWGSEWWLLPWVSVSDDYGTFLGGGISYYKYAFKSAPYLYKMRFRAGFSAQYNGVKLEYNINFPNFIKYFDFDIEARFSELDVLHYFGFGNERALPVDPNTEFGYHDYYKVDHSVLSLYPSLKWKLSDDINLTAGLKIKLDDHDFKENTYIVDNPVYGTSNLSLLSGTLDLLIDKRDHEINPKNGFYFNAFYSYNPAIFNNDYDFTLSNTDLRFYLSTEFLTKMTLATRLFATKVWGKAPFFEYPWLGGYETLRGFENQRFAGNYAYLANIEARIKVANYRLLVPGEWGIILFSDIGRVYIENEQSELWHNSIGTGLWMTFIDDNVLASAYTAFSKEMTGFYFQLGFMY